LPDEHQADRRRLARALLQRAAAVVAPSTFVVDQHRRLFDLPDLTARVIAPGLRPAAAPQVAAPGSRIAVVGSVTRGKGGHLLPPLVDSVGGAIDWHVFGGGDVDLLDAAHRTRGVTVHGYYRAASLPALFARHQVGLAVLPSMLPESFGFTLSECWQSGVPAVVFDHGALGERVARHGGGWRVPPAEGVEGLAAAIRRWMAGERPAIPSALPTPCDAAGAHLRLYRELGLIG
jgi:glycosyltransferase involved in cell wall biosynthesis